MTLKEQIDQDIKEAMKAKNKEELTTLRSIKSLILIAETDKGSGGEISEETELKLLTRAAKQRRESADIFTKENREDLAAKEEFEYNVISRYLPKQLDESEVSRILDEIIAKSGAAGPGDMGKVMGMATKELAGKAEGKLIADLVKQKLLNK